jgi:hypothetical protein
MAAFRTRAIQSFPRTGIVTRSYLVTEDGTYTVRVSDVVKPWWFYDLRGNEKTADSIVIP